MTSEERRQTRYERRKAAREEHRREKISQYDDFNRVADYNSLYRAYKDARKGVTWKASVQRYGLDLCKNLCKTHNALIEGKDVRKGFIAFDLMERGKLRHIQSVHFSERVPQKSLSQNALMPVLSNSLIYDNGASRKGMGVSHAIDRTTLFLREYYREHGNEGYILQIDLKDYFGSIPHEPMKQLIREKFTDEKIIRLTESFIDAFADAKMVEVKKYKDIAMEYGDEYAKGLGLGSEICQICAVSYPDKVDHYIKEKLRIRPYVRYMDDSFIIHPDKEKLKEILEEIKGIYASLGIRLNEKKTKIVKLSRGFTFLKTHFILTDTGKVVKRICRESVTRERRKLKKFAKLNEQGEMSFAEIREAYNSWRGYASQKDAYKTIRNMDALFNRLFIENWVYIPQAA
jgi:hypothetical protein|nr:MAG TPA: hypothetical protein [Caudoviricetes sp.]